MPLTVRVIFTGVCAILHDYGRVLLPNAQRTSRSCDGSVIPSHQAYIRYRTSEDQLKTPPDKSDDKDRAAIFLNGDAIVIRGEAEDPAIQPHHIPLVTSMQEVFPDLQLLDAVLEPPEKLSHVLISAYFLLEKGRFLPPNVPTDRIWHFFPPKRSPVHGPLAQGVTYLIKLETSTLGIALQPFGSTKATDVLRLKPKDSDEVTIIVGNTRHDDIFPKNDNDEPHCGPDRHFEIYYRLVRNPGVCPRPIPHYEGKIGQQGHGGDHWRMKSEPSFREAIRSAAAAVDEGPSVFSSLGGANCPPAQWP